MSVRDGSMLSLVFLASYYEAPSQCDSIGSLIVSEDIVVLDEIAVIHWAAILGPGAPGQSWSLFQASCESISVSNNDSVRQCPAWEEVMLRFDTPRTETSAH